VNVITFKANLETGFYINMDVYKYDICLQQLCINIKQAFDSIDLIQIVDAVKEFGIHTKLISLTKLTLSRIYNKVRT
jgi:hypothetical protein